MNQNFAIRIRELRESLNQTQAEFSEKINVAQAALSTYEKGTRKPTLDTLIIISKAFNVSLDWLCGFSEYRSIKPEFTTYSDLFRALVDICSVQYQDHYNDEKGSVLIVNPGRISETTEFLTNDGNFQKFFTEWRKMHDLLLSDTIDFELYDLWLKKELSKYNRPINGIPF